MAAQRILQLKEYLEEYPALARRLGLDPKTVRTYYRGESGASLEAVAMAVRVGGVSAHWLLTGEGPQYTKGARQEGTAIVDPLVVGALEKARGVVAELERAAGIDAAHNDGSSESDGRENRGPSSRSSSSQRRKNTQP